MKLIVQNFGNLSCCLFDWLDWKNMGKCWNHTEHIIYSWQNIKLHVVKKTFKIYQISDKANWNLLNFQYIKCHDILWVAVILLFTSWKSIKNKILIKWYKQDYRIPLYELYELVRAFQLRQSIAYLLSILSLLKKCMSCIDVWHLFT